MYGGVSRTLEEFENGGFTLKTLQITLFRPHYAGGILKAVVSF